MPRVRTIIRAVLLALAACPAAWSFPTGAGEPDFVLQLAGTAGVEVAGSCDIETASGPGRLALGGPVPQLLRLLGRSTACRIEKTGQPGTLRAEVSKNGRTVSRTRSNASNSVISIDVD